MPGDWFDQNAHIFQQPQGQPGAGLEQGVPPTQAQPAASQQPAITLGANGYSTTTPGRPFLLGFEASKLLDPNSGSKDGSKYTPAAKAFGQAYLGGMDIGRGNLDPMVNYLKANGFQNATSDGKQKIDFGDGNGLVDVIRSDGQIVFQNTTGNPTWEGKGYKSDTAAPMALGSLGQMPQGDLGSPLNAAPNPYMGAPTPQPGPQAMMGGIDPQQAAQQQEQQLRALAAQKQGPAAFAPQTVQGPQAQALRIPGFANGVQDFEGGPAIVGEKGPELVNLPPGSDVIPNRMALPGLGPMTAGDTMGPVTMGGGGAMPQVGSLGPMTLGGGGSLPQLGSGGVASGQSLQTGGYSYNPMAGPQNYNPQALQGPGQLTLGSIGQPNAVNAGQVGPGQQVQAGMVQPGQQVNAERISARGVETPAQIAAERVSGPAALNYDRLQSPGQFQNLSLSQFQADPSYQFDVGEQLGAIQNSAAAKGMLHHPNTIRGLQETAGNLANRQYDAVNARNLALQQQNFGNQATVAGQNNAASAQAYGLTNQFQQQAALANQGAALEAGKFNVGTGLQAGMFNAQQGQSADQFNAANALQSGQFNSAQQQQANLANVGNQLQAGQFNSQQGQQAALANQSANLNAGQFNANMGFQTQQANIGNQLAAYNAYQPLQQQNQQFNAAQQASAAQNNFANQFSVNQANNAGSLGAFNANLGAELGRGGLGVQQGQLALGNKSADQSYNLGQGNLALGNRSADQSYDLGLRNNALGYYGAQNSYNLGLGNLGVSQGQLGLAQQGQQYNQDANTFNTNYGIYRDNRDTSFNHNLALTQIGANAAGNYGNQAGALYTNQGNANGAAAINQGNAWGGALGTLGNTATDLAKYYASQQGGK